MKNTRSFSVNTTNKNQIKDPNIKSYNINQKKQQPQNLENIQIKLLTNQENLYQRLNLQNKISRQNNNNKENSSQDLYNPNLKQNKTNQYTKKYPKKHNPYNNYISSYNPSPENNKLNSSISERDTQNMYSSNASLESSFIQQQNSQCTKDDDSSLLNIRNQYLYANKGSPNKFTSRNNEYVKKNSQKFYSRHKYQTIHYQPSTTTRPSTSRTANSVNTSLTSNTLNNYIQSNKNNYFYKTLQPNTTASKFQNQNQNISLQQSKSQQSEQNKKIQNNFVLNDRTQTPGSDYNPRQKKKRPNSSQQSYSYKNPVQSQNQNQNQKETQQQQKIKSRLTIRNQQLLSLQEQKCYEITQMADIDSQSSIKSIKPKNTKMNQKNEQKNQNMENNSKKNGQQLNADQKLERFKKILKNQEPFQEFIKLHNTPYDPNWDKVTTFEEFCPPYILKALGDLEKHEKDENPDKHLTIGDSLGDHRMEVHRVKYRIGEYNKTKQRHFLQLYEPDLEPQEPQETPKAVKKKRLVDLYKKNDERIEKLLLCKPPLKRN